MFQQMSQFHAWFDRQRQAHPFRVRVVPLADLDGWSADPRTGAVHHRSGKFFTIDGIEVRTNHGLTPAWSQPIIDQPESGILGILVRRFDGVPHFLMQAKVEPGNVNVLQLSPTVQATRSNYTRVHGGKSVPYLDYFRQRRGRILSDVLQSEQGAWFLHKRNRNMIIMVDEDVPVRDGFCWLTRDQLGELLKVDNLVNMDSRSVLAGYPFGEPDPPGPPPAGELAGAGFYRSLAAAEGRRPAISHGDIAGPLSWFTDAKARYDLHRRWIPLNRVPGWTYRRDRIVHDQGSYFSVIGVDVTAGGREVARWSQPMLAPVERGIVAFLVRPVGDQLQVLVQARTQAGTFDVVEMAPTVQCAPGNYEGRPAGRRPPFLDRLLAAPPDRIRLDVVHSEEGGRFYHAENRYLVVEVDDGFGDQLPPDFAWMALPQLAELARYGNYLNVEARNLLACLRFHRQPQPATL